MNAEAVVDLDAADRAIQAAMPMLMAPLFGPLPPLADGARRFVAAADGVYVQARTAALDCSFRIAKLSLPFGIVSAYVTLRAGPVPREVLERFQDQATAACPSEAAALIVLSGGAYALHELPVLSASGSHVSYSDVDVDSNALALDVHSHGLHKSYFSATDDDSDLSRPGPHLSMVMGSCESRAAMQCVLRLCMAPYLIPLPVAMLRHGTVSLSECRATGDSE